jgi:hypothetical protein
MCFYCSTHLNMPRSKGFLLDTNFKHLIRPPFKSQRAICIHCGYEAAADAKRNTTHLNDCKPYQTVMSLKQHQEIALNKAYNQTRIPYLPISKEQQKSIQQLAAKVCYEDCLPFTVWQGPAMKALLSALNPSFNPPNRNAIAEELLDIAFKEKDLEVRAILSRDNNVSLCADASTDTRSRGVINLSYIQAGYGVYSLETIAQTGTDERAEEAARQMKERISLALNGDFNRLSSIAFDTCSLQLKVFKIFAADPDLKHVINVLCNSHGLNLFISDIFRISYFKDVDLQARDLISHITRKKQMYWLLRKH